MITLRDYQNEACDAVKSAFNRGLCRVGVSLPTGTGKSLIMAKLASEIADLGGTCVALVHRDVLITQLAEQLAQFIPRDSIGIVKAEKNETDKRIIVASVHSLRRSERLKTLTKPSLLIVDEAHVSVAPLYMKIYEHLDGHAVGFTATWMRSDRRGLGDIWEDVVYRRSVRWAVNRGILVPPRALQLGGDIDLSGVRVRADGDYNEHDLGEAVMLESLKDTVVRGYHAAARGRSSVLFAPTKQSASYFANALKASGVTAAEIFDSTGKNARKYAFSAFSHGVIKVLVTCTALAEGWDAPRCDTALLLRPTRHVGLFIQQVGRILRPYPGKAEALVLDFVGVTDDLAMRSVVDLSMTPEREEALGEETGIDSVSVPEPQSYLVKRIQGVTQVDLLSGTDAHWLVTKAGVPFIQTRTHIVFVHKTGESCSVGVCSRHSLSGGRWLAERVGLNDAMEVGADWAMEQDSSVAGRKSSWRQGRKDPTDAQLEHAERMGVCSSGMTKAELSDALSIEQASRVLDVLMAKETA